MSNGTIRSAGMAYWPRREVRSHGRDQLAQMVVELPGGAELFMAAELGRVRTPRRICCNSSNRIGWARAASAAADSAQSSASSVCSRLAFLPFVMLATGQRDGAGKEHRARLGGALLEPGQCPERAWLRRAITSSRRGGRQAGQPVLEPGDPLGEGLFLLGVGHESDLT